MPTSVELANSLVSAAGSGDAADAALVAARLAVFPVAVLARLQQNRTRVRACRNSITDHLVSLRGVQPRGWPPGSTWDSVPGIFNPASNEVVIAIVGHDTPAGPHVPLSGEGEGSADLVVHETGHGLDMGGGSPFLSAGATFIAARNADLNQLTQYELQPTPAGEEETFAESGARFFISQDSMMPNLHAFWDNIANELAAHRPSPGIFSFPFFPSIGSASVASDGTTIRMRLRAIGEGGVIGDALLSIPNTHPAHQQIRDHVKNLNTLRGVSVPNF
jgi:hypothetical protein